jgi:tryptophanyl-tRNA synthetase
MREKYIAGGYGYGHAKKELFNTILEKYKLQREKYSYLMQNTNELEALLSIGEKKAAQVAQVTLRDVRQKLGF